MKRIIGMLALVTMLMLSATSFAADKQIGVYVAPKFVYGLTHMGTVDGTLGAAGVGTISGRVIGSKTDHAFGGSLAIGYDFSKQFNAPIRTEIEYAIFSDVKSRRTINETAPGVGAAEIEMKAKVGIQTLFANVYWDIDTGTKWQPYLTGGLGMAFVSTKGSIGADVAGVGSGSQSISSKTNTNFAWNLGLGIGYVINDYVTVDAGYRFVGLGTGKTGTSEWWNNGYDWSASGKTKELYQHQFAVGVRFTF